MAGYHVNTIIKGQLGEASKIQEELEEFLDALSQGSYIMALLELSDMYGAIEMYIEKHHSNMTMNDIRIMSNITKRAFESGDRK